MALQRLLAVGLGTTSSLFFVYLLCLNLESPLSIAPFRNLQVFISRGNQSQSSSFGLERSSANLQEETPRHGAQSTASLSTEHPTTANTQDRSTANTSIAKNTAKPATTSTVTTPPRARSTTEPGLNQSQPGLRPTTAGAKPGPKSTPKLPSTPRPKPGPTEPPFIGDSYYREDPPPLTDCPNTVRRLVSRTDFGTRFRPDVPILQWSKHLSPEQYQRLRQYPGAHGWGALSYETLVETLSALNSSRNGLLLDDWPERRNASHCIRCAVVGNGGILKDSRRGAEIDQHHYVFRTNGAIIKGFELDVGSRTTHYTFSTNTLRNSLRSYGGAGYSRLPQSQETRYVFLPDHDRDYLLMKAAATHSRVDRGPERNIDPAQFFGADVTKEKLKIYHPDFIRYLRNQFLRSNAMKTKYKNIYRPSTGAVMLLAALHSCDQVTAYGFMTPDYGKYSDHYYDKTFHAVGFYINHDLHLEMSLWQQLHKAGLIHLYMHQDQEKAQNQV